MTPAELSRLTNFQLLDVRLPDDFEATHLTQARNNCVFEISFLDRLAETAPDPSLPTVVYGANSDSMEAAAAAEKLRKTGYTDVRILAGGLQEALSFGLATETGTPLPEDPEQLDGRLPIDLEESNVEWLGRNLINKHWGTAAIESGYLEFKQGLLDNGEFIIDLHSLACTDLKNTDMHDVLIAHLHSDDFFDVEKYPKARFKVTGALPIEGSSAGAPNLDAKGELTLRGQTHPIQFDAVTGLTPEGHFAAQATTSIDRTKWGVLYGSGKFFHRVAGHLVNDMIEFQIKVITK